MNRPQLIRIKDKNDLRKVSAKFSMLVRCPQIGRILVINNIMKAK
jgi:hypothetical protein